MQTTNRAGGPLVEWPECSEFRPYANLSSSTTKELHHSTPPSTDDRTCSLHTDAESQGTAQVEIFSASRGGIRNCAGDQRICRVSGGRRRGTDDAFALASLEEQRWLPVKRRVP
jgi:hypothetical protein